MEPQRMVSKSEQRESQRLPLTCPVMFENYLTGNYHHDGRMVNYSRGGLCFEADMAPGLGAELFIGIESSPYSSPPTHPARPACSPVEPLGGVPHALVIAPRRPVGAFVSISFMMLALLLLSAPTLWAADTSPAKPGPKDKCPVCGMFVAKYPDFLAVLTFKDGTHTFFDGVKDMMRYYLNLQKYSPSRQRDDIVQIHVTDYYSLGFIDGFKAFYIKGSDIYGPMGQELIPFEKEADAREFLKDHKGKADLRFQDINKQVVMGLD